jgi:hypothetical protein
MPFPVPRSAALPVSLPSNRAGFRLSPAFLGFSAIVLQLCSSTWAQAACASDGQRPPTALVERFTSADCEACWADRATPKAKASELALDWIVPTAKGDDAPLSAAATRDALARLESLRVQAPATATSARHTIASKPNAKALTLRVAHGVALGGYMGTSIELKPARGIVMPSQPLTAWLLLVEQVPAGTDGTPVARNLVRNALLSTWNIHSSLSHTEQTGVRPTPGPARLYESRPMSIPAGANPEHLRVVGWVEDARGRVIASAASVCAR